MDFDAVRTIALALPEVVEGTIHGQPAWRVGGRLLACPAIHRSAEAGSLAVKIDFDRREELIAAQSGTFYVTDHYLKHPTVLVRLAQIDRQALKELLTEARRFVGESAKAPRRKAAKGARGKKG
jgi:hypothetical protein